MIREQYLALGRVKNTMRELTAYGNARKAEIGAENVYDFSLGSPSAPVPEAVTRALLDALAQPDVHEPVPEAGLPAFREAVADDLRRRFGMDAAAEYIYATVGAAGSLAICANALLQPGEEAIVVAPFFSEYRVFIEGAGGVTVVVGSDARMQPDLAALRAAITERTRFVIVNTPNNPTGALLSAESLGGIAAILREAQQRFGRALYLVSDEPYRELVYDAQRVPCVMNAYENTILCYSYSKSLSLPGERIGYLALNTRMETREAVFAAVKAAAHRLGYRGAPSLLQRALVSCVGESCDIGVYRKNREVLYEGLTALGFECLRPEGAFYLFMKAPIPDAVAFSEAAKRYELLLVPCDSFGVSGYMRLAYCVPTETIRRAMPAFRRLAEEFGLT